MKNFSKILKESFEGKNLSFIAKELNIPKQVLHDWVHGERLPSMKNIEYVKRLSEFLGLSLEELLLGQSARKVISSVSFMDEGKKYIINIEKVEEES
jgi:ribosome-binding protein aMBF1 (putative translation factor)